MRLMRTNQSRIAFLAAAGLSLLTISSKAAFDHLSTALGAARWLDAAAIKTPNGWTWPADPKDSKSVNVTLYSGTPGIVLFYLEAQAVARARELAGGEAEALLLKAKGGAEELLAHLSEELGTGLYEGVAGIGFALEETYKATKDPRYRDGFLKCLKAIKDKSRPAGQGLEWGTVTDIISGAAGTGLVLLYAAAELQDRSSLDLAEAAGRRLIELGKRKDGGLDWAMDPAFPRLMPNFSHGTAGVAYFLARLYEDTRNKEFLEAALAGARYLLSIAKTEGDTCLIFHDEPDNKGLYYLGWCHGPVGTANLFFRLHKITGDKTWLDWVLKEAKALITSGIPDKETPGFWNNAGLCCGLAGVGDFFLNLYKTTRDPQHLAFFNRVMEKLSGKATADGDKLRWIQAEHRTQPALLIAQTGLMQGAAGIGLVFLHWDELETGRPPLVRMPDSAFFDSK